MTTAVFAAFQAASGDTHPVHYDVEYCRARGMPNLLAHGFQTLIHTAPGTPVTVSVRRDGDDAVLEVADRGPGVPADLRERVFERFARGSGDTARAGGSGLGLAIVKAVTDAHGGTVELLDAPGGGARFVVSLPIGAPATVRSDSGATVFRA